MSLKKDCQIRSVTRGYVAAVHYRVIPVTVCIQEVPVSVASTSPGALSPPLSPPLKQLQLRKLTAHCKLDMSYFSLSLEFRNNESGHSVSKHGLAPA